MLHVNDDGRISTDSATSFRVNESRAAWLRARKLSIGASEIATLCGLDPRSSLLELYAKKTMDDDVEDVDDELEPNDRLFWGTVLQPAIAKGLGTLHGWRVIDAGQDTQFFATDFPRMTATLDYVIAEAEGRDGPGILEVKNVDAIVAAKYGDKPDPRHVFQVQAGLAATGLSWGVIGALVGGNRPRVWYVEADASMHATLRELVNDFFEIHVDPLNPPAADDSKATERALRSLFPEVEEGRRVRLPESAVAIFERRREIAAELSRLEREKRGIDNRVKLALSTAEEAFLPGVGRLKRTIVHVGEKTISPYDYALVTWPKKTFNEKRDPAKVAAFKKAVKDEERMLAQFADADLVEIPEPEEIEAGRELNDEEDAF